MLLRLDLGLKIRLEPAETKYLGTDNSANLNLISAVPGGHLTLKHKIYLCGCLVDLISGILVRLACLDIFLFVTVVNSRTSSTPLVRPISHDTNQTLKALPNALKPLSYLTLWKAGVRCFNFLVISPIDVFEGMLFDLRNTASASSH